MKTLISEFFLNLAFPTKIIDLHDYFTNLKNLEKYLETELGIKRTITEKGKYSEYYKVFKGKGINGYGKQIEPIGTYNMIDTLTPLMTYLVFKSKKVI